MPIELKMPAISPTMEYGTVARWLVKEGDIVVSGDLLAEIETEKATVEFEATHQGIVTKIVVPARTEDVKVGDVIALLARDGDDATEAPATAVPAAEVHIPSAPRPLAKPIPEGLEPALPGPPRFQGDRIKASPRARQIAKAQGVDLRSIQGSGPLGRIVRLDVERAAAQREDVRIADVIPGAQTARGPGSALAASLEIPHVAVKLSNMRKTIARRLTQSKQQVPHIYLTIDVRLDALLALRADLNASLQNRGLKLSVNDILIKALAVALVQVPACNVQFADEQILEFGQADISVAVSIPDGLITPVIVGAESKSLSTIATEMQDLANRARGGRLKAHEYQGGTASLSNMGMLGIKQFDAVINPPQAMIMAVGAGEKQPWVIDGVIQVATVMSATGSFDHRAIDGADGARLLQAFKRLVEQPAGLLI